MTARLEPSGISSAALALSAVVHGGIAAAALAMAGLFAPPTPHAVVAVEVVFELAGDPRSGAPSAADSAAQPAEEAATPIGTAAAIETVSHANPSETPRASPPPQPSPIEGEGVESAAVSSPSPSMGEGGVGVRREVSPENAARLRPEEPSPQIPAPDVAAPEPPPATNETAKAAEASVVPPKRSVPPPPRPTRAGSDPPKPPAATTNPRADDVRPPPSPVRLPSPDHDGAAAQTARAIDDAKSGAAGGPTEPLVLRSGNAPPAYPEPARRRGWEGRVVLRVLVDITGLPTDVAVGTSSGFRMLDDAAIAAVRRWRFEPARFAGVPVIASVNVPVTFRLTE